MSKLKLLSIAVFGLLIINIAIVVFLILQKSTQPHLGRPSMANDGRPPMPEDGPKNIIIDRLNFNKEQLAQYEKLIVTHQSSVKSLGDSIRIAKNKLYETLTDENFSGKDSLITKLSIFQNQIEQIHYDHFAGIKKLCKQDQLDDFTKLTKELARFFAPEKKDAYPPKD